MRRIISASLLGLALCPVWAVGHAATTAPQPAVDHRPVTLVQGWWESEHRWDRAREAYWRLPPPALERYNRLQYEIDQLAEQRRDIEARIRDALQEQHELLGFRAR